MKHVCLHYLWCRIRFDQVSFHDRSFHCGGHFWGPDNIVVTKVSPFHDCSQVGITCNLHFLVPTSAFTNVHTWLAMLPPPPATCTGGGLSSTNQAFTNVHTHTRACFAYCSVWWWWRWYICSLVPRLYCGNGLGTRLFCDLVSPSYPIIYQASTIALASSFYIGSQANRGLEPNTIIPLISNTQLLIN